MSTSKQRIASILLIDDDLDSTHALVRSLERRGADYDFYIADTATKALEYAKEKQPEAAVVDLSLDPRLGPESGLYLLRELQRYDPSIRTLVLTGHGSTEYGIKALQSGAASFLEKPVNPDHLLALLQDAVSFSQLKRSYLDLQSTPADLSRMTGLSSRSACMQKVIESVAFAASNKQAVLVLGETGTGKGVISQAIHNAGAANRKAPFIRYQPSYTNSDLVASELFGHVKGAFTGASEDRRGLVEDASSGTLFIDEVGEIPHETQILLLNVLQEHVFRRLGSNKEHLSNFRLIAATNRSAEELLDKEALRLDFYHRIAHFTISIPPLRERIEDIPMLSEMFLLNLTNRESLPVQGISPEAVNALCGHNWPGNIRELQAVVEGGVYRANFCSRKVVELSDLDFKSNKNNAPLNSLSFREQVNRFEISLINEALIKHNNNQSKAAESLELDRSSLRRIMQRSGN